MKYALPLSLLAALAVANPLKRYPIALGRNCTNDQCLRGTSQAASPFLRLGPCAFLNTRLGMLTCCSCSRSPFKLPLVLASHRDAVPYNAHPDTHGDNYSHYHGRRDCIKLAKSHRYEILK